MRPLSMFSLQSLSFSIYFPAALGAPLTFPLRRSASIESTQSEREFRRRHQAITHRMVHRKSSAIMYNKILERTFGESLADLCSSHIFQEKVAAWEPGDVLNQVSLFFILGRDKPLLYWGRI